jgi:hypothetical protein
MRKLYLSSLLAVLLLISLVLASCATAYEDENYDVTDSSVNIFVDERFELVSLVFRLAGRPEYNETDTSYQRMLNSTFSDFKEHPAVIYTAQNLHFGYDAVFGMAVHLEKSENMFMLSENLDFLMREMGGFTRWTEENVVEFVSLLNDFYSDTNFAEFFEENTDYYKEHSIRFEEDVYGQINFNWFEQYGFNPNNLRAIVSPAASRNAYGSWVYGTNMDDTVIYASIPGSFNYSNYLSTSIHEFAHSIANPLADIWYFENKNFRIWSDFSVDLMRNPQYTNGLTMAYEYLTRAYTILYMMENTDANLQQLFINEKLRGFTYIEQVYALITDHEVIERDGDINIILGVDNYIVGEEKSVDLDVYIIKWRPVDLLGHELDLTDFTQSQVGNVFDSQTGDVLYVTIENLEFLFIDIGSAEHQGGSEQHRMYSIFSLN